MFKKIIICSFVAVCFAFCFSFVLAEETETGEGLEITAEELDIEESGIFSWFKNAVDTIQIWITRDPIKKAGLELKKASRQIVKAREFVQNNADDENLQNRFNEIDEKYQGFINRINNRIGQFDEENLNSEKFKNFFDKYIDHQFKHLQILEKLENQVPETVMEKIQEKRQEHLEKFNGVMNKIQEKKENKEQETNKNNNDNGDDDNNEEEDDNNNGNSQNNSGNGQQNQKGNN